jgi:hypothetical protein
LDVEDLGNAEGVLKNRQLLGENARALLKLGVIPTQDGWGGWLGKYQAALAGAANGIVGKFERQTARPAERRQDRSRGR